VVDLLGGRTLGWGRLMKIPEQELSNIGTSFMNGTLDYDQAVRKLLEALDEE
jgi:hypothetical protein